VTPGRPAFVTGVLIFLAGGLLKPLRGSGNLLGERRSRRVVGGLSWFEMRKRAASLCRISKVMPPACPVDRRSMLTLRMIGRNDYSVREDGQPIGRIRYASERTPGIWLWPCCSGIEPSLLPRRRAPHLLPSPAYRERIETGAGTAAAERKFRGTGGTR